MKQRTALWDNIKFLLITLVVVGHLVDNFTDQSELFKSIFLFIYAFHMPLFLFVSGLFHSNRAVGQRCLFYLSVGFLQKIAFAVLSVLTGQTPGFSLLSDGGIPWFMFVLAAYTGLMYLLRNQNKKYLLGASLVLACFAGYDQSIGDYLYLSRVIAFFPFYLSGMILREEKIIECRKNHRWLVIPAVLVLVCWGYLCVHELDYFYEYRYLFTGRNPFFGELLTYGPVVRLACYGISSVLCFAVIWLVPDKNLGLFSTMGTRSIDVYFWHSVLYRLLECYCGVNLLISYGRPGKIGLLCLGVGISVLLSQGGIFSFPLKQIKTLCFSTDAAKVCGETKPTSR